jgi:hypothetical protein
MGDIDLNLDNKGYDNNSFNKTNNTNTNLKEVHNNDNIYSINGNFVYNKDDFRNHLRVFHQHIWGLNGKTEELVISLHNQLPNIICKTEHHMIDYEIDALHIPQYKLGAKKKSKKWWCMYIHSRGFEILYDKPT